MDTLVRMSHLAMHFQGHLAELDINPLLVLPRGQGVKAVDALLVFRGTQHRKPGGIIGNDPQAPRPSKMPRRDRR
jgi:hypothetical protein